MADNSPPPGTPPPSSRALLIVLVGLALGATAPMMHGAPDAPDAELVQATPAPVLRAPAMPVIAAGADGTSRLTWIAPWAEPGYGGGPWAVVQRASMRPPITPASHRVSATQRRGGWLRIEYVPRDEAAAVAPPALSSVDLAASIDRAVVSIVRPDGTERTCDRFVFGRWVCGPDEWNHVSVTDVVVRERAAPCIWAHPTAEGELRITFPALPRAASLTGRHALADTAADIPDGAPVAFDIDVDGVRVSERSQANRRGWTSWRAAVPDSESATMDVTFRVRADAVGARHFCFTAALSMRPDRSGRADEPTGMPQRNAVDVTDIARPADGSGHSDGSGGAHADGSGAALRPGLAPDRPVLRPTRGGPR